MGAKIVGIISGLFVIPFMTKYLNPLDIGVYSLIIGLQLVISTIISLQLQQPINVLYFEYKNQERKNLITQSILSLFVVASFSLGVSLLFIDEFLLLIGSNLIDYLLEVRLGIVLAYFSSFSGFFEYLFRVSKKSKSLFNLILCMCIGDVFFKIYLLSLGYGIKSYLLVMLFTSFITILFEIFIFRNSFINIKFEKNILVKSLNYSIPLIPYAFLASLSIYLDRFFLERFFTLEILGLYFIAYKASTLTKFIAQQISLSYQTFFFEKANQDLSVAIKSAQSFAFFQIIIVLITVITTNIFSKEVFLFFFDNKYSGAYTFFLILNCSTLFRTYYNVKSMGLFYLKKTNLILLVTSLSFFVGLIFNFSIIKLLNFNSIPFIVVLSQLLSYLIIEFYFDKYIDIKINKKLIALSIIILILSYLPYFNFLQNTFFASLYFKIILFFSLTLGTLLLFYNTLIKKIRLI